jgi:5'-nucleotidase
LTGGSGVDIIRREMAKEHKPQILLTNDDGIRSPGLWAAAEALSRLGFVTVAAPREQSSGAGRSMPVTSDGKLHKEKVAVGDKTWDVYAVGGTPAQAVQHGVLELMDAPPDLVVAGINYGENLTIGITISGTVGAALEGAALGIPAMAVSLEMSKDFYLSYSDEIDFSAARHFTFLFADMLLNRDMFTDVDALKIDIPCDASPKTEWRVTKLSRHPYYVPVAPRRTSLEDPTPMGFEIVLNEDSLERDSDVQAIAVDRVVSVTPLSLDLTSRVNLGDFEDFLRESSSGHTK